MSETDEKRPGPAIWPSPAKLNLFLHVLGRRPDGYHDIQTLFQILDWGDEIRIRLDPDGAIVRGHADYAVAAEEDLAVRAARLLRRHAGGGLGARIDIHKRIPLGAGLGGGSSNAATVLVALNRLWGCGLSPDDLAELGAALGADVSVFVHGHTALAGGTGDRLQPVRLGERHYVLVLPALSIPTRDLFEDPDLSRDSEPISPSEALGGRGRNDFEPVVRKRYPAMAEALDVLRRWGRPVMTGTGSAIFLQADSARQAADKAREIKNLYNVRAVCGVDRSPLHRALAADDN